MLRSAYLRSPALVKGVARRLYYSWSALRFRVSVLTDSGRPIANINRFERKFYSQHGEDGIIITALKRIGSPTRFCVEVGVGDGKVCCTRLLVEKHGWRYVWLDASQGEKVSTEFITADNINELFLKHDVPREFDVLSIDIDYNTYWVWKAIQGYTPRLVVVEYNGSIPVNESKAVPYGPTTAWDRETWYFGASLRALFDLGKSKGYELIGCDSSGTNAFFVRNDLVRGKFVVRPLEDVFRPGIAKHKPADKSFIVPP